MCEEMFEYYSCGEYIGGGSSGVVISQGQDIVDVKNGKVFVRYYGEVYAKNVKVIRGCVDDNGCDIYIHRNDGKVMWISIEGEYIVIIEREDDIE